MYPEFIAEATKHSNAAAIRTFHNAIEAEKTHARLYSEAIALVESGAKDAWIAKPRDFFVCPVCGYTSRRPTSTTAARSATLRGTNSKLCGRSRRSEQASLVCSLGPLSNRGGDEGFGFGLDLGEVGLAVEGFGVDLVERLRCRRDGRRTSHFRSSP